MFRPAVETQVESRQRVELEAMIGYTFKDKSLLREAIKLPVSADSELNPVVHVNGRLVEELSNMKLALVGDALLRQIVRTTMLEAGYTRQQIGRIVEPLMTNARLIQIAASRGLQHLSPRIDAECKSAADTVEALIAAVHIDSGHSDRAVRTVLQRLDLLPAEFALPDSMLHPRAFRFFHGSPTSVAPKHGFDRIRTTPRPPNPKRSISKAPKFARSRRALFGVGLMALGMAAENLRQRLRQPRFSVAVGTATSAP